ncbi:phage tail tube protein [Salipiger sp.]|uniref:phage tail tube protein n=1 Tax=Salipiger sp. TaxID=2078585 RepID=UPI003A97778C
MTNAKTGYGSKFGIEGETPGEYVDQAEIVRIKLPGYTRDEEEATHLQSPDRYKEFIAAMKEAQPVEIEFNWIASESDAMLAAFEAETGKYQITAPNGVRLQFSGYFLTYSPPELTNGKMSATATIRPSGKPTLLAAA